MGSIWARVTFGERPRLRTQCLEGGARGTPGSATFRGRGRNLRLSRAANASRGVATGGGRVTFGAP